MCVVVYSEIVDHSVAIVIILKVCHCSLNGCEFCRTKSEVYLGS